MSGMVQGSFTNNGFSQAASNAITAIAAAVTGAGATNFVYVPATNQVGYFVFNGITNQTAYMTVGTNTGGFGSTVYGTATNTAYNGAAGAAASNLASAASATGTLAYALAAAAYPTAAATTNFTAIWGNFGNYPTFTQATNSFDAFGAAAAVVTSLSGLAGSGLSWTNGQYAVTNAPGGTNYVSKTGDTMTGNLTVSNAFLRVIGASNQSVIVQNSGQRGPEVQFTPIIAGVAAENLSVVTNGTFINSFRRMYNSFTPYVMVDQGNAGALNFVTNLFFEGGMAGGITNGTATLDGSALGLAATNYVNSTVANYAPLAGATFSGSVYVSTFAASLIVSDTGTNSNDKSFLTISAGTNQWMQEMLAPGNSGLMWIPDTIFNSAEMTLFRTGLVIAAGGMVAPNFYGSHFGNGAGLTNITESDPVWTAASGNVMTVSRYVGAGTGIVAHASLADSINGANIIAATTNYLIYQPQSGPITCISIISNGTQIVTTAIAPALVSNLNFNVAFSNAPPILSTGDVQNITTSLAQTNYITLTDQPGGTQIVTQSSGAYIWNLQSNCTFLGISTNACPTNSIGRWSFDLDPNGHSITLDPAMTNTPAVVFTNFGPTYFLLIRQNYGSTTKTVRQ